MVQIETHRVGPLGTNCYFVINRETSEMIVIDPGAFPDRILKEVRERGLIPKAILLTHGHFDHIMGIPGWKTQCPDIVIGAGAEEATLLEDTELNMSARFRNYSLSVKPDLLFADGDHFSMAGIEFQFIFTPGHTSGSGCYYVEKEKILFSGDTLFALSMGRTDFPGGSEEAILNSLARLMQLPSDVRVLPGHEGESLIGAEQKHNPYCRLKQ